MKKKTVSRNRRLAKLAKLAKDRSIVQPEPTVSRLPQRFHQALAQLQKDIHISSTALEYRLNDAESDICDDEPKVVARDIEHLQETILYLTSLKSLLWSAIPDLVGERVRQKEISEASLLKSKQALENVKRLLKKARQAKKPVKS